MTSSDVINVVAAIVTLASLFFSLFQYMRYKEERKVLESIHNNLQAMHEETLDLEDSAPAGELRARIRVVGSQVVSLLNTTDAFLFRQEQPLSGKWPEFTWLRVYNKK
jgi:hypothetical protein